MRRFVTERNRNIIQGGIGILILVSMITLGIKFSFGAFDGGYRIQGTFAAAGQGLLSGSDVKIRGVNVGEVKSIELVDNQALLTLRIAEDTRIPTDAQAVIRPKTLFGEKFIDIVPGPAETTGPYLADGGVIQDTLGGFELERVLADAFPVIDAIDPMELGIVLDELALAGEGLGENINRSLVNAAIITELAVSNDAEFRQLTADLALLTEELDRMAPDLVAGARDLNVALPTLNDRSAQLTAALTQASRLASDVADLLEANEPFTTAALTTGADTLQTLFDNRSKLQPLLVGLSAYTETVASAIRFEVGDGSMMAAVKNLVGVNTLIASEFAGTPLEGLLPAIPDLPVTIPTIPIPGVPIGAASGEVDDVLGALFGEEG